ncbi:MAG: YaaA family protein [Bacteroidaceae bacterium]|nr:YaaA family protein [Bacteroidaceae bacterium]
MHILLSPAKDMAQAAQFDVPATSSPAFQAEAEACAMQMSELSADELARVLAINPQLAALNKQRYHDFVDPEPRTPAILAYTGMAYRHLRAADFSHRELEFAQSHMHITSFLYGLNRPLDLIKDHRLEGKVVLPDHDGQTMFRWWRPRLTDHLIRAVEANGGTLVNLASAEMKQLFDWRRVERAVEVITPEFMVQKAEGLRTVVVYAKMMRGAMTRQLIALGAAGMLGTTPLDALRDFTYEGFAFRPEHSTPQRPVWVLD